MEANFALVDVEKAVIGEGDAMGVSRDVGQDLLEAGEGRFGGDPPLYLSGWCEVSLKGAALAERLQVPEEGQLFGVEGLLQRGQEQPAEEASEHADGQKEGGPAGDPTAGVGRENAARHRAKALGM